MIKTAVILCAGKGTKMWPYAGIRNKVMIPVSGKPVAAHTVESLQALGVERFILVTSGFGEEIKNYFRHNPAVEFVTDAVPRGTAFSLLAAKGLLGDSRFLVCYGDVIAAEADWADFMAKASASSDIYAMTPPVPVRSSDHIGCTVEKGRVSAVLGHSRVGSTHYFAAFAFSPSIFRLLAVNSGRFTNTEVGMMSPTEAYLEMTLADAMADGQSVCSVVPSGIVFDIDKPWHILEANYMVNERRCAALTQNELAENASIDSTATIEGFVRLGKNSRIGRNVVIEGSIIVGDDTVIKNGAILAGNNVIGSHSRIYNACFLEKGSTVGDECHVGHAAELSGIVFNRVYLYHYMEINGIIGENTDLGAATVCGSLRFDDGVTTQRTQGRQEAASPFSDSVFLGDYCRTGVNAILMPGVKVGNYSIVGAGVNLQSDLQDNTLVFAEQNQVKKHWGHERYGW